MLANKIIDTIKTYVDAYKLPIGLALTLPVAAVVVALAGSYAVVEPNKAFIVPSSTSKHIKVGLVLGSGVDKKTGKPFKELQGRLDTAAQAYRNGVVDKLIVSGDNRFVSYNEPKAMRQYLVNVKHIPASVLQPDYAGRSTYESCERASKVFGLEQVMLISARSHLPRAIFLCRHFGIESYGMATDVEANNNVRREALARVKALLNAYVYGEKTILGSKIAL